MKLLKWSIAPSLLLLTAATVVWVMRSGTEQWRAERRLAESYAIPNVESGVLSAAAGSATLKWNLSDASAVVASYLLPFTRHGSMQYLGGSTGRFLVSGAAPDTAGNGTILLLELQRNPVRKIVSVGTPVDLGVAVDPGGIAWNSTDGYLYVLDCKGKRLLAASWAGGNNPLPTVFATAVDSTAVPRLVHADVLELKPATGNPGVYLSREAVFSNSQEESIRVYREGGAWKSSSSTPQFLNEPYKISSKSLTNSRGPLWFMGQPGNCRILDEGLNEVMTLSMPGGGDYQAVALPDPYALIPGGRYKIVWPDASDGGSFRPMVRYGTSQSSGDIGLGGAFANSKSAFIGSNYFGIVLPAWIKPIPAGTFSHNLKAYLHIAVRLPSGEDPVTVIGDAAILQPIAVLGPWDHVVDDVYPHIKIAERLRIPNDPGMVGSVILWQWVVTWGGGELAYSEVFGTTIFGGESSYAMDGKSTFSLLAKAAYDGVRAKNAAPKLQSRVVAAARKWLGSPDGVLPAAQVGTTKVLLKAMISLAKRKK